MSYINDYVKGVMRDKNLKRIDVIIGLGYVNLSKGVRKFEEFLKGDYGNHFIKTRLHEALNVDKEEMKQVISKAIEIQKAELMTSARNRMAELCPILFVETERKEPIPAFPFMIMGYFRLKNYQLPRDYFTYSDEEKETSIKNAISKIMSYKGGRVPSMGKILHFILVESVDVTRKELKVYDLAGNLIKDFPDEDKVVGLYPRGVYLKF